MAEVRHGSRRDAVILSLSANKQHGLKRKPEDKRKCVMTCLSDPEWRKWSDPRIAKVCAVSHTFVWKIRNDPESGGVTFNVEGDEQPSSAPPITSETNHEFEQIQSEGGTPRVYTDKHGNTSVMDTSRNAGKRKNKDGDAKASNDGRKPPDVLTEAEAQAILEQDPWYGFNQKIEAHIAALKSITIQMAKDMGYDSESKQLREKFANGYSYAGAIGSGFAWIRLLNDGLPTEPSDKAPGFLTARQAEIKKKTTKNAA